MKRVERMSRITPTAGSPMNRPKISPETAVMANRATPRPRLAQNAVSRYSSSILARWMIAEPRPIVEKTRNNVVKIAAMASRPKSRGSSRRARMMVKTWSTTCPPIRSPASHIIPWTAAVRMRRIGRGSRCARPPPQATPPRHAAPAIDDQHEQPQALQRGDEGEDVVGPPGKRPEEHRGDGQGKAGRGRGVHLLEGGAALHRAFAAHFDELEHVL